MFYMGIVRAVGVFNPQNADATDHRDKASPCYNATTGLNGTINNPLNSCEFRYGMQ